MMNMQKYLPQLLLGILLLVLAYSIFSLPAKLNSSNDNEFSDTGSLDVPDEKNDQNVEGKLSAAAVVYGFSIGEYSKAYPLYVFENTNVIYDKIADEPVIITRDSEGKVIMSHAETGEVFIPVEVTLETWLISHPNTLIFSYND